MQTDLIVFWWVAKPWCGAGSHADRSDRALVGSGTMVGAGSHADRSNRALVGSGNMIWGR